MIEFLIFNFRAWKGPLRNAKNQGRAHKSPASSKRSRRQKRVTEILQKRISAVKAVSLPELKFDPSNTLAVVLLYLPYNKRSSLWERFQTGTPLNSAAQEQLRMHTHDFLLISTNDDETDQSNVLKILPEGVPVVPNTRSLSVMTT